MCEANEVEKEEQVESNEVVELKIPKEIADFFKSIQKEKFCVDGENAHANVLYGILDYARGNIIPAVAELEMRSNADTKARRKK